MLVDLANLVGVKQEVYFVATKMNPILVLHYFTEHCSWMTKHKEDAI